MHAPFHNTALILVATVLQPSQQREDLHPDTKRMEMWTLETNGIKTY